MARKRFMITTYDNPWNPWTHYDEWLAYDLFHGYHTNEKLAVLMPNSNKINEFEDEESTDLAIDELCELVPAVYTRIYQPD